MNMYKILISGGTGLIGKHLQEKLLQKNHEVVILSRKPKKKNEYRWDISDNYIDENAFKGITHIIHLAGAGIADKRWTTKRKKELIDSRVKSANLLFKKVKDLKIDLKGFIAASGVGFYGAVTSDKIYTEKDLPHNDFISKVCVDWENASNQFNQLNIPVTILRTGIVLSKKGGALPKINTPLFLAALGSGKQYMPWIHIDDLSNLYIQSIEKNNFSGIYNAVAPEHQTNNNFTQTIAKVLKKITLPFNVPSFVLKIILGELANILLKGSKVSSKKTVNEYTFLYPKLKTALKQIYDKN